MIDYVWVNNLDEDDDDDEDGHGDDDDNSTIVCIAPMTLISEHISKSINK